MILSPLEDGDTDRDKAPALLQMIFAHTDAYPGEAPLVYVRSEKGLSDEKIEGAAAVVGEQVEELMGMPMIFNIITALKEWLVAVVGDAANQAAEESEHVRARKREEAEIREREAARAHGTPVTPEVFAEWKARFEAEMALQRAKLIDVKRQAELEARPTGREWFEAGRGGKDDEVELGENEVAEDLDAREDLDEDFLNDYGAVAGSGDDDGSDSLFDESDDDEDFLDEA